jgi:hypothetical protein
MKPSRKNNCDINHHDKEISIKGFCSRCNGVEYNIKQPTKSMQSRRETKGKLNE